MRQVRQNSYVYLLKSNSRKDKKRVTVIWEVAKACSIFVCRKMYILINRSNIYCTKDSISKQYFKEAMLAKQTTDFLH